MTTPQFPVTDAAAGASLATIATAQGVAVVTDRSGYTNGTVASAAISAAGSGYAVGDTVTLANGIVLTVATLSSTAISTVTVATPGNLSYALISAMANPVAQVSTSGAGTAASFTLTWIGIATLVAAANTARRRYRICNLSSVEMLWINDTNGTAAANTPGSYPVGVVTMLNGAGYYEYEGTGAISVYGASSGHPFSFAEY